VQVYGQDSAGKRQTRGEFDFLFASADERDWRHWEVAVKFYLFSPESNQVGYWIGPGGHDRLDIKLSRLYDHQLKLGSSVQGQQQLQQLGIDSVQTQAWIKGYLFYPPAVARPETDEVKLGISPRHLSGWWLRQGATSLPVTSNDSRWWVAPKHRWLSPALMAESAAADLLSLPEVMDFCASHFAASQKSLLLVEMEHDGGHWCELDRGFVVCPQWPRI
jgi:hypothetical protein